MLKRIRIRGKLLLLLATPLVAVMVFAYSGIVDRTDRTSFEEGQARIAELADAGSDLSLAIQIERIRVLEVERLMAGSAELLETERETTNQQFDRWVSAIESARGDMTDPTLVAEFDELAGRLPNTLTPDRGADAVVSTLLASASRAVDDTTLQLEGQAQDLNLFRSLSSLNDLLTIQSSYATITSIGSEAIFQDQLTAVAAALVTEAEGRADLALKAFEQAGRPQDLQTLLRLQQAGTMPNPTAGPVSSVVDIQDFIRNTESGGVLAWLVQGEERLIALNGLIDSVVSDATAAAQAEAETAREEAQSFLVLAGSVVLLALLMAVIIGRSISRPLTRLTRNAEQLSAEELPALVESMRSAGRTDAPVLTPIEAKGRDEVAQLAHAISEIQQVTIDVADEQTDLLRRGISDIFVNLARRNQSLLDRQIDFIDQLESREENPDQLENLFRLDHLATRMRRNAESLLVLAGAEPPRRRGRPVEIGDVLRVAMGEIEDFSRIQLMAVDPSTVAGSVAVDLAHLMSELMENATQFSPPDASVEVVGYRIAGGNYQLTLADRGIGMSAEQITTANTTLAEPPLVGLDLSRSLGFTVISRLAHRLGVTVQLTAGAEGGVTAVITIPAEMVGLVGDDDVAGSGPEAQAPDSTVVDDATAPPAPTTEPVAMDAGATFAEAPEPEPAPMPTAEAAPSVSALDEALLSDAANPFGDVTPTLEPLSDAGTMPQRTPAPFNEPEPAGSESIADLPSQAPTAPEISDADAPALPSRKSAAAAAAADATAPDSADLFSAFGAAPAAPDAPIEPTGDDLFAAIGNDTLPTRTPTPPPNDAAPVAELPSAPSTPDAPAIEAGPGSLPQRAPATPGDFGTLPTGSEAPAALGEVTPPAAAPLPSRDPAPVGTVASDVTSAGLIRRTPKHVDVPEESKYAPAATATQSAEAPPASAAANRSPDEVRQMLSRYRAGLRKGRGPENTPESSTSPSEGAPR